jgi:glycine/D-amino acid oxidase-like deaminating enzyme
MWAKNWQNQSYWLDGVNPIEGTIEHIPKTVDVLIIGSGYTGLHASIQVARSGREALVIDSGQPGFGCSTRNGGQISTSVKPSQGKLEAKYGQEQAREIRNEGENALKWIEEFIDKEEIDCSFSRCGRFHAAHSQEQFDVLAKDAEQLSKHENIPVDVISKQDQKKELGTDLYSGGVVFHRHASVDPAKYHRGLLNLALGAGTKVVGNCHAEKINKVLTGFEVLTSKGTISCKQLVIATNGYTSKLTPWLQRRVIPIGSYIIATEPLEKKLMDELFPTNRIVSDTCKVVYYYRPSPDRTRVLFGGRVSAKETNPSLSGPKLHYDMCRIFPKLSTTKISHSWFGTVAYTFDELAHTGCHDGIFYSMGYCGSGVSMASYLGMRLGQKVIGAKEGVTPFDDLPFPTRPFYSGNPWFLPAVVSWYRWRDKAHMARQSDLELART